MNLRRLLRTWSASYLARHGNQVRRERERARYRATNDALAASVGKSIPWARQG